MSELLQLLLSCCPFRSPSSCSWIALCFLHYSFHLSNWQLVIFVQGSMECYFQASVFAVYYMRSWASSMYQKTVTLHQFLIHPTVNISFWTDGISCCISAWTHQSTFCIEHLRLCPLRLIRMDCFFSAGECPWLRREEKERGIDTWQSFYNQLPAQLTLLGFTRIFGRLSTMSIGKTLAQHQVIKSKHRQLQSCQQLRFGWIWDMGARRSVPT